MNEMMIDHSSSKSSSTTFSFLIGTSSTINTGYFFPPLKDSYFALPMNSNPCNASFNSSMSHMNPLVLPSGRSPDSMKA